MIVQSPVFMNHEHGRNALCFKSRPRKVTSKGPGFTSVRNPEPLYVNVVFRDTGVGGGTRRWCCLRHDFRSNCNNCGSNGAGVPCNTLQELAAVEGSVNIKMDQILYVFLVGF